MSITNRTSRRPLFADLDPRLQPGHGCTRTELNEIIADHDTPPDRRCLRCGWQTSRNQPGCPSAVVARAIRDHSALPVWLADLDVPGAAPRRTDLTRNRQELDSAPGLFPVPPRGRRTT